MWLVTSHGTEGWAANRGSARRKSVCDTTTSKIKREKKYPVFNLRLHYNLHCCHCLDLQAHPFVLSHVWLFCSTGRWAGRRAGLFHVRTPAKLSAHDSHYSTLKLIKLNIFSMYLVDWRQLFVYKIIFKKFFCCVTGLQILTAATDLRAETSKGWWGVQCHSWSTELSERGTWLFKRILSSPASSAKESSQGQRKGQSGWPGFLFSNFGLL